ncbi:MAG: SDR family NAD(P)-dependent oxidoreductase, partial [Pseudomonadota bacterium]
MPTLRADGEALALPAVQAGDLAGRVALVTGASRGIGKATALALANAGAQVIALAKNRGGLEELDDEIQAATGHAAALIPLNLAHTAKVNALGPSLYERFGKLDIFVSSAGTLGPISPLTHVPDDEWATVLDLNLTAPFRLLRTLDPILRLSDGGRVVMLTSVPEAAQGKAFWGPYAAARAGVAAMTRAYACETVNMPLRVNLFDPGPVATRLRNK